MGVKLSVEFLGGLKEMARAYQCDKCRNFYFDDSYTLHIRDTVQILIEKDICESCKDELEEMLTDDKKRWRKL